MNGWASANKMTNRDALGGIQSSMELHPQFHLGGLGAVALITLGAKWGRTQLVIGKPGTEKILLSFIKCIHDQRFKILCFKGADKIFSLSQLPAYSVFRCDAGACFCTCKVEKTSLLAAGMRHSDLFVLISESKHCFFLFMKRSLKGIQRVNA